MDGRGRVFDNIFIERFWRTIKYEDIYLRDYQSVPELIVGLADFFHGGAFNARYGNKLMQARVALQAVAVLLLLAILVTSG